VPLVDVERSDLLEDLIQRVVRVRHHQNPLVREVVVARLVKRCATT
jgi:hypothetical protein